MEFTQNISKRKPVDISSMVYGKVPPQAKELEEVILGALMIDASSIYFGMSRLFPEIFYVDANQKVFKAIQNLYDKSERIDMLTVVQQLRENEDLENIGGMYYITKLTQNVVSSANIENHISIIAEMYLKREAIRLSGELINDAYDDTTDAFDVINTADSGFQKIQEQVLTGMSKDIGSYGIKVLQQHAQVKETGILGISTGLQALDSVICGLVAPDLLIVAARPGQGKTALMLSITYNTSVLRDIPCAWFSLEMDGTQLVRRLASIDTGINHEFIRKGETTTDQDFLLTESINKISQSKIFIEDKAAINVRDIRTRANLLKKRHNIQYIVVDYLQLMKGIDTKNKSRENIVSDISRSLKEIAKELEIPVIALSQLSREVEKRPDKMPQLSDLRESGGIEQDADEVIFLMRPEYYHMIEDVQIGGEDYNVSGLCICSTAKNRHGSTKNTALSFKGHCMHFTDYKRDFYSNPPVITSVLPYKDDEAPF